ncbi:hypothetical protein T459_27868 [Capsicum annuum]|uniref:Ubiquitin-like protease family profile domain-containing protein n=1 Tax=Capsicum annuum TaxID=4072 RepID=A0A2G2YFM6_CAPAN|nr:hypothetical protein T459_27868 [Capsicum annuum]
MLNSRVVKPKPRYEDLMDGMFSKLVYRNITPSPQELNHVYLPNPLMFGSTDDAANIAQAIAVHQQSERTAPTEFGDEFNDFSTLPSESEKVRSRVPKSKKQSDKLSKDKNLADSSIDRLEPRVSLDKDKVVPNVKMRDADKAPAASEEKLSLSKSDLDDIKSYVRTYVDMKFNDFQKLMVDQYTGLLGVVKEEFASFGKVAQYPVHESEKGNPNIEVDPPQSANKHTTDAKSYNVVDAAGQSFKLGVNEGATEESLKKAESLYVDKLQEDDRHITDAELVEVIMKERVYMPINCKGSFHWVLVVIVLKERCIRVYDWMKGHRGHADEIKELAEMLSSYLTISDFFEKKDRTEWSFLDAYKEKTDQHAFDIHIVDGIVQQSSGMLHCGLFVAAYAEFLSDRHQIPSPEFDSKKHRTRYTSLLWDYGVNKACTRYVVTTKIRLGLNAPSFDLRIQR